MMTIYNTLVWATSTTGTTIQNSLVRTAFIPRLTQLKPWHVGQPCSEDGDFLLPGTPPPMKENDPTNWFPYDSQLQFETAQFLFTKCQMSASKVDALLDLWASSLYSHGAGPPFTNHRHMLNTIDSTTVGDVRWQCLSIRYTGEIPQINPPSWMSQEYDVWFRDPRLVVHKILGNRSFAGKINLRPFQEYTTDDQTRQYKDFMSGDWAWCYGSVRLTAS